MIILIWCFKCDLFLSIIAAATRINFLFFFLFLNLILAIRYFRVGSLEIRGFRGLLMDLPFNTEFWVRYNVTENFWDDSLSFTIFILDSSIINHIKMQQYQVNRLLPRLIHEIVNYHVSHPDLHKLPVLNLAGLHGIELLVLDLNLLEHIDLD